MLPVLACGLLALPATLLAQAQPVPQPFPRPAGPVAPPSESVPALPEPVAPVDTVSPAVQAPVSNPDTPNEQTLGIPVYPTARFIDSYDAGRGQRYYLFGTNLSFAETVAYYRNVLDERGDLVFESPATHMFELGRFDEDRMAFPPGVTVKDYTWNGSEGYLNPQPGVEPTHFRTVIQIVPLVPGARR